MMSKKLKPFGLVNHLRAKETYEKHLKQCMLCKELIPYSRRTLKTCSKKCSDSVRQKNIIKLQKMFKIHKGGGYREGSGRSKSGYYQGIYCGSTYELVFLIYSLDHNKNISRCTERLKYKNHQGKETYYLPDFIIDEQIFEIKGYLSEHDKIKMSNFPQVKIIFKEDFKYMFDYVKNKTKLPDTRFFELYDNAKPSYHYKCDFCKVSFSSFVKRKKNLKYCSQSCAGKYQQHIRKVYKNQKNW